MHLIFLPLHLHHGDYAIPADDMDLLGGPDALPALGTNELSGGAGPLAARGGSSRLGGASGPSADISVCAAHVDVLPSLGDDEVD